ncbi:MULTISPECIES: response regulator transcription factor [Actinoplanes]|uniref:response regulator n=1 Tax=Actinoplanes TaxID=1865 RepID=UPI001FDF9619|nr:MULTISPECIES: response regulator transcription factor [Actinoplanes]
MDDHTPFVRGLEHLLPEVSGGRATVVATTGDTADAVAVIRDTMPDVVLVEVHVDPADGLKAIAAIREAAPRARILAMSGDQDPMVAVDALRAGAAGFLPKTGEPADMLKPLLAALEGWAVMPTPLLTALVEQSRRHIEHPATAELSEQDRRLLRLIANGSSTNDIAGLLHVSERTVKRLTASLLRKLQVSSRTEAAALAGSAGLV